MIHPTEAEYEEMDRIRFPFMFPPKAPKRPSRMSMEEYRELLHSLGFPAVVEKDTPPKLCQTELHSRIPEDSHIGAKQLISWTAA